MIIVLKNTARPEDVARIASEIKRLGFQPHISRGEERTIIGLIGDTKAIESSPFEILPCVEKVLRMAKPFKLAGREFHPADTIISLPAKGVQPQEVQLEVVPLRTALGGQNFGVMAGPCAIESREQALETAQRLREYGISVFRGGAYKPRTSPYSFQGLRQEGLDILQEVKEQTGLAVVTEVLTAQDLPRIIEVADVVQIGARNMQNFSLLEAVGKIHQSVLLKRGMGSTLEELLLSAEYILAAGNSRVMLCERGIRTFEKYTRNTLDISAVPVLKELTHLPVIVDPSHATGNFRWVPALAKAALVAGADGLLVEVHPCPEKALCDGVQSLTFEMFEHLLQDLRRLAPLSNRRLP